MKKLLLLSLSATLTLSLMTGCSSKNAYPEDATLSENGIYTNIHDHKKLKKLVIKAAKEKGWRVTEYTENAVIAEKVGDGDTKATTIKIHNNNIDFENSDDTDNGDIVDLKEYIEDLTAAEEGKEE